MHKNVPLVLRILSSSVTISSKAGSIIRDIVRSGNLKIVDKGINDLQTEADRSAQKCIVKSLEKQFPKISIIGEENLGENYDIPNDWLITKLDESILQHKCPEEFQNLKDEDIIVWVDPLDGTSEFANGCLDHVTILIGLSVKGKAIGGVIHQPFFKIREQESEAASYIEAGRTIWGLVGLGAFGIDRTLPPSNQLIVTTSRSHGSILINKTVEAFQPSQTLMIGGAGNKVLKIIEGKAHCYVFPSKGCKKWDTCAPEGILHSLGGQLTDIAGNQLTYKLDETFVNQLGILASFSKEQHTSYCKLVPQDVIEKMLSPSNCSFN